MVHINRPYGMSHVINILKEEIIMRRSRSERQSKKTLGKMMNKMNNLQIGIKNLNKKVKNKNKNYRKNRYNKKGNNGNKLRIIGNVAATPNPIKYRLTRPKQVISKILSTNKKNLIQYIYGLIYPDRAISECLQVKKPSSIPIPSTTFGIKRNITLTTNASGNLSLIWIPNYLMSVNGMKELYKEYKLNGELTQDINTNTAKFTNLWYCNDAGLTGSRVKLGWHGYPIAGLNQDFARYRLTSALIKVKYTGNKLNQAGMMYSSATYKQMPYTTAVSDDSNAINSNRIQDYSDYFDVFTDFDVTRNGQWNKSINITANANGLEALYVPTDPLNDVFQKDGFIQSVEKTLKQETSSLFSVSLFPSNTNLKYSFVCQGLPPSSACVTIETYYNFEIIVEQEQMPYFHTSNSAQGVNINDVNEAHQAVINSGQMVKQSDNRKGKKLDQLLRWGSDALSIVKVVSSLI